MYEVHELKKPDVGFWISSEIKEAKVFLGGIALFGDHIVATFREYGKLEKGWGLPIVQISLDDIIDKKYIDSPSVRLVAGIYNDKTDNEPKIVLGITDGNVANIYLTACGTRTEDAEFEASLTPIISPSAQKLRKETA